MGLTRRLRTGLTLARDSVTLLRDHPRLLWFPAVAGVAGVAFFVLAFGGAAGVVPLLSLGENGGLLVLAAVVVGYLGASFLTVLFTAGLMFATRDVVEGREPSVRAGLSAAWEHKSTLFAWAIVSTLVGAILRGLQESDSLGGVLVGGLLSGSWAVVTYFVVPVAVFEDEDIRGVVGRSVDIVRDTWGESLGAEFGLGLVWALCFLLVAAVAGLAYLATSSVDVAVAVGLPLAAVSFVVAATLNGIAKVALYEYATTGDPPNYFENVDFDVGGGQPPTSPLGRTPGQI